MKYGSYVNSASATAGPPAFRASGAEVVETRGCHASLKRPRLLHWLVPQSPKSTSKLRQVKCADGGQTIPPIVVVLPADSSSQGWAGLA